MRILTAISFSVLLAMSHAPASAILISGLPVEGNSWSQGWNETGVGNFNSMQGYWVSGSLFEAPSWSNFTDGSWSTTVGTSTYVSASGSAVTNLTWNGHYADPSSAATSWRFAAFLDGVGLEYAQVDWNGSGWNIYAIDKTTWDAGNPVPEPSILTLIGVGAIILGLTRRRRTS